MLINPLPSAAPIGSAQAGRVEQAVREPPARLDAFKARALALLAQWVTRAVQEHPVTLAQPVQRVIHPAG
jgi:hypothetical protein